MKVAQSPEEVSAAEIAIAAAEAIKLKAAEHLQTALLQSMQFLVSLAPLLPELTLKMEQNFETIKDQMQDAEVRRKEVDAMAMKVKVALDTAQLSGDMEGCRLVSVLHMVSSTQWVVFAGTEGPVCDRRNSTPSNGRSASGESR